MFVLLDLLSDQKRIKILLLLFFFLDIIIYLLLFTHVAGMIVKWKTLGRSVLTGKFTQSFINISIEVSATSLW